MCGISGQLDLSFNKAINSDAVIVMSEALKHRGQSDYGNFSDGNLSVHFNRLAIMDPTSGEQPFFSPDRKVVVFCNGEIFNHQDLKNRLGLPDSTYQSASDCEVLPHLYQKFGIDFVKMLNGQFAIALYDLTKQKFFLVRDHFGVSPMHFAKRENTLIFASEIKAILAHPLIKPEVNLTGLDQVFTFPGLVSPQTMFKDVFSVENGHYLEIGKNEFKSIKYWDLTFEKKNDDQKISRSDAMEKIEELLIKSIERRLMSHVPVGLYLSGGLDSSLICAITRKLKTGKLSSFSITFDDQRHDESKFQNLVSCQLNLEHHAQLFKTHETIERLKKAVYFSEAALKESYNGCSLALSQNAKANGISVILSGEGADELFGGYVGHRFDRALVGDSSDDPLTEALEEEVRERLWGDSDFFYEKSYYEHSELRRSLYSKNIRDNFNSFNCTNKPLIDNSILKDRSAFHKRSYLDFKLRLCDHLVSDHGDRMSMANTVEARYPFLDVDLINYTATLPAEIFQGKTEKALLKDIAKKYLPDEVINREKFGFRAQGSPYFLKQNVEWVNDLLSASYIKSKGFFDPEMVERLKKTYSHPNFTLNVPYEDDLLMTILTFNILCETYNLPGA